MPSIVNYLDRAVPARSYSDEDLTILQQVYDRARKTLDIDTTDVRRERIAILIFQEAEVTTDPEKLLSRVVRRFLSEG
jgi:hypothetical protein